MQITSVRVTPIEREKVLAVVTVTLSDCFVLRAMRLMEGRSRDYLAMPVRQTSQGGVFEVYHPINREARDVLEDVVTRGYESKTAESKADVELPIRMGSDSPDFVITGVRVKTFEEQKLRGFASLVLDDCLAVNGIKIIAGKQRRFVQMPNVRRKSGKFRDLAFPIKPEIRQLIEETVFGAYEKSLAEE
jgi:stage V sporulation protein G